METMNITRIEAEKKLQEVFGIAHFYDEQWRAIERLLRGERILMIQRTGFGKSLCYQFPAILFKGLTVVFSPLIALMRDQVRALNQKGIPAAYINSEQTPEDNTRTIERALAGELKILYIAPERQENREWMEATQKMGETMRLSMVVIDEAHTISTWGHDFRPAFRRIIDLVQALPLSLPVLATTATATRRVQADIEKQVGGQLTTLRGSLVRDNLYLRVIRVKSDDEKMIWLAQHLPHLTGTGLIYTGTRLDTERYAKWLRFMRLEVTDYHAGYDAETRKSIERGLMSNRWKCVVSTNALGMGIDKPDIRFIIHTQLPTSPVHYYQEIGRAGRDGNPAHIILFFNETKDEHKGMPIDLLLPVSFIENARPTRPKYEEVIGYLRDAPLGMHELLRRTNLKQTQLRVILSDLIDQQIIREAMYDRLKKYEYRYDAPALDTTRFEALREAKLRDLQFMHDYVYTASPRMQYLCHFLDSDERATYRHCDNTDLSRLTVVPSSEWDEQLDSFRSTYFPELEVADVTGSSKSGLRVRYSRPDELTVTRNNEPVCTFTDSYPSELFTPEERTSLDSLVSKHRRTKSRLLNGYAASYYGVSNVGAMLHRSKYEGAGDFPDILLKKVLAVYHKKCKHLSFDLLLYVPPTRSGHLVRHFAEQLSRILRIPISHGLVKTRDTKEQKVFQSKICKRENLQGAFTIDSSEVEGKNILLIDDICDSGVTLQEIGSMLTRSGAQWILPLVIAQTAGGTPD